MKRGEGTYVADRPAQARKAERTGKLRDAAMRYASAAMALGVPLEDAAVELAASFELLTTNDHRRNG